MPVGWALILSNAAPMIGRLVPLAECIRRLTGMRSVADRRRPDRRLGPARQLWHRHGCGGEVLGLRAECVSMASEVHGTHRDPDVEVGLWWGSLLAP